MLKPQLEAFSNIHLLGSLCFYHFWLLPCSLNLKHGRQTQPLTHGFLVHKHVPIIILKTINGISLALMYSLCLWRWGLHFKKAKVVKSKDRLCQTDHFAKQKKWNSQVYFHMTDWQCFMMPERKPSSLISRKNTKKHPLPQKTQKSNKQKKTPPKQTYKKKTTKTKETFGFSNFVQDSVLWNCWALPCGSSEDYVRSEHAEHLWISSP